ncbi:MAG: hypothetical protein BGO98_31925 [Myxococcales bacterium 68-20]|nr:MAG: hypothetical protein BGO98_31925 [Myxococcales bacterium 68-20]
MRWSRVKIAGLGEARSDLYTVWSPATRSISRSRRPELVKYDPSGAVLLRCSSARCVASALASAHHAPRDIVHQLQDGSGPRDRFARPSDAPPWAVAEPPRVDNPIAITDGRSASE